MSDYDFDEGYTPVWMQAIKYGIVAFFTLGFIYVIVLPVTNYYTSNEYIQDHKTYQTLQDKTQNQLSSIDTITCNDIQNMREQSLHPKHWYENPLGSDSLVSQARDLWNIKNCGSHWGWFEP